LVSIEEFETIIAWLAQPRPEALEPASLAGRAFLDSTSTANFDLNNATSRANSLRKINLIAEVVNEVRDAIRLAPPPDWATPAW
jgi:hypothetical protein